MPEKVRGRSDEGEGDKRKRYDEAHAHQQRNREKKKIGQTDEERQTDMYFYIKCPDVTSSEGVWPRGSTLINKVTQR